jgi:hypothetical protein
MLMGPAVSGRYTSHLYAHLQAHLRLTGGAAVSWYTGHRMVPPSKSRPLIANRPVRVPTQSPLPSLSLSTLATTGRCRAGRRRHVGRHRRRCSAPSSFGDAGTARGASPNGRSLAQSRGADSTGGAGEGTER